MSIAEKLITIAENESKVYEAGLDKGAEICSAKHLVYNFVGDGSGSVSFHVPFEPDAVHIIGFDPTYTKTPYAIGLFCYDRRAFGTMAGAALYGNASGASTTVNYSTTSALNRYSRTEDGVVTIGNISSSLSLEFSPGYVYTAIAVKYTEQTDKERITAFVSGLTGSGTVTLNRAKVNAAFTDDEWATLIATKPNWTFTWI